MKKLLIGLFVFLLSLGLASATVTWESPEPTLTMNEDASPAFSVDLSSYVDITLVNGTVVYSIGTDNTVSQVNVNLVGPIVTFTTDLNWNGNGGTITFVVDDADNTPDTTSALTVTVTAVNDAPVWNLNDEYFIEEGVEFTLDIGDLVTDADGDTLTLNKTIDSDLTEGTDYTWTDATRTLVLKDSVDPGIYTATFTVDDGVADPISAETNFIVVPEDCLCEEGEQGDNLDVNIKEPDNKDVFNLGDTIDLEIEATNKDTESMDIIVKAILYNLDQNEEVVSVTSEEIEIEDGEKETFDLSLEIPTDAEELDPDDTYLLFVKAYEDDYEDDNCVQDRIELELELEKHQLQILSFELSSSTAAPGDVVEAILKVRNIGSSDEDIVINLIQSELGLDKTSDEFELDEFGKKNDETTKRISFLVPANAKNKDYPIEATVEYDDGDEIEEKFTTLTVKSVESNIDIELGTLPELKKGQTYNLPVEVTNMGDALAGYIVSIEGDWFSSVSSQVVALNSGETKTVNFALKITESGAQIGKVIIKDDDKVLKTKEFTANILTSGGLSGITGAFAGAFEDSDAFWVIGDIVLVIVAIFFLKLIFSSGRRHQPVEEIKL